MGFEPVKPVKDPRFAPSTATINDPNARTWGMLLHLSLFTGYLIPIVIWALKKDELEGIDAHGKMAINFMISITIYAIVSGLGIFVLIGIPMLVACAIVSVVFPIIGAIKAKDGIVWDYPLIIKFL